jgi:dTDP-4-amino-4,6-dideoxygalactose transaminase
VTLPGVAPGAEPVYHLYTIRSPERDRLRTALAEHGVASALYYHRPHHLQPVFAHLGHGPGSLPVTEQAAAEGLALPMFPTITAAQQQAVVEAVASALVPA